jgi:DNA-binding NtrC family response regulator
LLQLVTPLICADAPLEAQQEAPVTYPWPIVVASADLESRRLVTSALHRDGLDSICTSTVRECRELIAKEKVALVFCEEHLADGDFRDVLSATRSLKSAARVVVTSREFNWDRYLEAMRLGAFEVIASPCRPTDVEWMVSQARRDERRRSNQWNDLPAPPQKGQENSERRTA